MAIDLPPLDTSSRDYFNKRVSAMRLELASFISHYMELAQFVRPRRGRWLITDRNKGDRRYSSIINSKATQAQFVARGGLLAGVASHARAWFELKTPDPDLNEFASVKIWLYKTALLMREIFSESNFYTMFSNLIDELLLFGTGAMTQEDDFQDVTRFYTHTAGSYMIAQNERFQVDVLAREFEMTCRQIVKDFGLDNLSASVRRAWDNGNYESWFPVTNVVEPNPEFLPGNPFVKRFRSVTYEPGATGVDKNKFLANKGYRDFPVHVPRWDVTGEDIYGTDCPAMTALGDIKQLQIEEKRKAQGIDKMVSPSLTGPASLRNVPINSVPNGVTLYDGDQSQNGGLRPLYQVQLRLDELRLDMKEVENRIDNAYFVELFKPISMMAGVQPKNQFELMQRTQEAMLLIGPVLERIHVECLSKVIERTFNRCLAAGLLPPAPPELANKPLKVEYISPLAMAQKQTVLGGIDRLASFVGVLLQAGITDAADKFDADNSIDEYASAIGVPPRVVKPNEVVAKVRLDRMQQQQNAQRMAMIQAGAGALKDGASGVASLVQPQGGSGQ